MNRINPFRRFAYRLRPDLAEMPGTYRAATLVHVFTLLWMSPFAIIGLIWLVSATDFDRVRVEGLTLLLLLGLGLLLRRFPFNLRLQLRKNVFASARGSFEGMVQWSASLLFGPVAIWLSVIETLGILAYHWRSEHSRGERWLHLSDSVASLARGLIGGLCGLWVYERLGGLYPFMEFEVHTLPSSLAATLAAWLIPVLLSLVTFLYMLRTQEELVGPASLTDLGSLLQMYGTTALFRLPVLLFAILAAGLYSWGGIGVYLFFMVGVLLVSLLARGLSDALSRNEQRSRELTVLEKLGESIIAAPPDQMGETLPKLLVEHVYLMLPEHDVAIWLFPDTMLLYEHATDGPMPQLEQVQTELLQTDEAYLLYDPVRPSGDVVAAHSRQAVAVPIRREDGTIRGGIYVMQRQSSQGLEHSLPALQSLASQIDLAIRRAYVYTQLIENERMARELEVAGRIQATFLPAATPQVSGWQIEAVLIPARQTSGDFYDFFALGNGRIGLLVADVADKGTGAALYMALSRTLIRTFALQNPDQPELALQLANERILNDTMSDQFVTVFYGVIDQEKGLLTYCNAGHNPAYLISRDVGGVQHMGQSGIPLGMFPDLTWQQRQVQIGAGDLLLLYTDGVTEAQDAVNELFSEQRLLETVAASESGTAQQITQDIVRAIQTFVSDAPQFDDITLVVALRE